MKNTANKVEPVIEQARFNLPRSLRWVFVLFLYLVTFSALDYLIHHLQVFPGVVAWYPPDGVSLAFLLTFGAGFTPVFTLASLISSLIVHRLSVPFGSILIWAVILSGVYGIEAYLLRRRVRIDPHLKNLSDILWLMLTSAIGAALLAVIAVFSLVTYGEVPVSQFSIAFFTWWVGEMIGVLVFTPFLLIYVMPGTKRFIEEGWGNSRKKTIFRRPSLQSIGQVISIPVALYLVFGVPEFKSFHPYYLLAGPLIWIALKRGFSKVSFAIVAMNFGIILAIWLFKFDISSLVEIQFLLFSVYASSLLTGAVVSIQKRTEEKLRQREVRNQSLIENAPDAISLMGADGKTSYISQSAERILGYTIEEWNGQDREKWTHPDDLPAQLKMMADLRQKPGLIITNHFRFKHKDGSWRWLESTFMNRLDDPSVQAIVINFRDITESKQSEETLQKSEKHFRALVENSLEAITLIDPDGTLTYESPSSHRILGYTPNKFVSHNIFDLFHPDDKAAAASLLEQFLTKPGSVNKAEFRLLHKDGSWRWLEGSFTNLVEDPGVNSIVINYRDITERKKAEQEIANLAMFPFENPNIILRLSRDGIVLFANPASDALLNLWGCKVGGLIPQFWRDLVSQVLTGKKNKTMDIECEDRFIELFIVPVTTPDYVNLYGRDITERKQVEEALQLNEEKYRTLVNEVNDGFFTTDKDGIFTYANSALARLYGVEKPEMLIGRKYSDFIALKMPGNDRQAYLKSMQSGQAPEVINGQVLRPDGTIAFVEIKPSTIYKGDQIEGARGVVRDVTERKQAEEELKISNAELSMLFELSHNLAKADNLEEILKLVNRHAVESIHVTFARIALLEDGNYIMRAGYPIRLFDHDLRIGERIPVTSLPCTQRILEQNEPMLLRANDPGISAEEKEALLLDHVQSLYLIPLRISDSSPLSENLIGLLMLGEVRNENREPFTPKKMRLAQSIGDSAAIAIRRMLLSDQTERRLQQLFATSEIDLAIISSTDLVSSLGVLLLQVIEQLKVDAADIWVFNPVAQELEFVSSRGFLTSAFDNKRSFQLGEGYVGQAALERRIIHVSNLSDHTDHPGLTKAVAKESFISYYAVPLIVKGQVKGVLELFHRSTLEPNQEWLNFLNTLANQAAIAIDNSSLFNDLQESNAELIQAYDATIQGWSKALDLRDKETEGHTLRVTELTIKLGHIFGLSEQELIHVRRGALLHDIGKMGVPDGILLKPGPLTDEEWVVMRKHPVFSYEMISPINYLKSAVDIPYCHHEKWDGTGYPRGLSGEQIPLSARIFAVVDVWDALTSDRPYRAAWPEQKVLDYIRSLSGTQFDPQVVNTCLESGLLTKQTERTKPVEPVQWSKKFSVGVKELDQQHQQLIKLLNILISTQGTISTRSETVSDTLMEMTNYAQTHFKTEERLMETYGYPGLEEQKELHHAFRIKTDAFSTASTFGVDRLPEALLEYLADWFIHHILEDDMAYRSFFKEKGLK